MLQADELHKLENVLRVLATGARSLRLYPASSPIPRQSAETVVAALDDFFTTGAAVLSLSVAREGFSVAGQAVGTTIPGARELAEELRAHGAAELAIVPGVSADELLSFLEVMSQEPESVRERGGLAALTAAAGAENIRVTAVQLTVVGTDEAVDDTDVEEFLRELSQDPQKLAAWFAGAASGDPAAFEEGLIELLRVAGFDGMERLLASLAEAFRLQEPPSKDALLELAMDPGTVREMTSQMFQFLDSGEIAGSVLEGVYGRNMLSLSSALTKLPLDRVTAEVREQVQTMLPGAGHTTREADFLGHMLEVRGLTEPEPALVDADRTYKAVLQAATVNEEDVERARGAVSASQGAVGTAAVRTMLSLLDQQTDFELYCTGAENLARMVPGLIEQGDLQLAARVINEISNRQSANSGPWPELSARLQGSLEAAAGPRSMAALVKAVSADRELIPAARDILRHGGDAGAAPLVAEAIAHKTEGIEIAEELLGRRVIDLLNALAPSAQWFQLGPIVTRLLREGDSRSLATIESLLKRPDEQSRREVVTALAAVGGPAANRMLAAALRDPSAEVAIVAARAIAKNQDPGSVALISARLAEIDIDGDGFLLGRELVGALARTPGAAADEALAKLASRRALIKRGHFAEVQALVAQAQQLRAQGGAPR